MPDERCDNCEFWHRSGKTEDEGTCHRFPPFLKTNSVGDVIGSAWPKVDADDWCGEWKAAEADGEGDNA